MKHPFLTTTALSATLIMSCSTAMADVTAAEVWKDWQKAFVVYGEDGISIGSEEQSGDTLTVSDVVLSVEDEFSRTTVNMGDFILTEKGDGTVQAKVSEEMLVTIDSPDGAVDAKIIIAQKGADILVSGDPENLSYAMNVDQYSIVVAEMTDAGEPIEGDVRFTLNNVAGTYKSRTDNLHYLDYDLNAGSMDVLFDIVPPDASGDSFTFSGKIKDLATAMNMSLPLDLDVSNPADIYVEGMALAGNYSFGSGAYIFDVISEGEQTAGSVSTGAGKMEFDIDHQAMSYDSQTNNVAMTLQGAALPFPVEISMAQYGTGMDIPFAKTEEPTDFGLRVNLTDLAVNDVIWMLLDPSGQLPHDPATLLVDLSGKVKLLFDMMDPEQAMVLEENGEQPAELHAMTLNNFKLSAVGAEVTGAGTFTFDNSDLVSFDGMPAPTGDITVNIKGANALMDKLVAMGMLPEDQAMMGRMMIGMFARSTGNDELTSKIEINDQGHIIANGQRIQ